MVGSWLEIELRSHTWTWLGLQNQFADDAAVYATSRDTFESAIGGFVDAALKWGLNVSIAKTKGMVIGSHCTPTDILPVQLERGPIEIVQEFTYLGSSISRDSEVKSEVKCRIGKAARAFGCLQKPIFQNQCLSVEMKRKVYRGAWYCRCFCMERKRGQSKLRV